MRPAFAWRLRLRLALLILASVFASLNQAAPLPSAEEGGFTVDPRTVQRWGRGYRYPQAGWTLVHIEGTPRERGLQHGHLLAAEITDHIRALSAYWSPTRPEHAWARNRQLARKLFGSGFPAEQMQEMQGIADGANAEGARAGRRKLDVLDIITINAANEIDTLDDALAVTPDVPPAIGMRPREAAQTLSVVRRQRQRPQRCNAFVANGPATRDGKILFGHITMYDLYPANFYNVWMQIAPTTGYRFVMQTTPGGMHSSMDYAINEAGMLLAETTLDQGPMVPGGTSLAARIRQAQQYADSVDSAVDMLTRHDNGLCSTEWLMGDLRRNEIALLTLAGGGSTLKRSSRNEWFEGAEGFYWSDNNIKEQQARLDATARRDGRPSAAAAYEPSKRDTVWLRKYREHKGRMDLDFAREALATPEIISAYGVDAKYTNADMAARLRSWGAFGPPVGGVWLPTAQEARQFPAIRPLIQHPWTVLDVRAPGDAAPDIAGQPAQDLPHAQHLPSVRWPDGAAAQPSYPPAWRGTLKPQSDADIWLSTGFANYERIVALERSLGDPAQWSDRDHDQVAVELAYYRSLHGYGVRAGGGDLPLAQTRASMGDTAWYHRVTGKGVLLLATLRGIVGRTVFDRAMQDFGRRYGGQAVAGATFQSFLQARTEQPLAAVFDWWLQQAGLPQLAVVGAESRPLGEQWETVVKLDTSRIGPALAIPVTIETAGGNVTRSGLFDAARQTLALRTRARPERVVVDKFGSTARANGSPFTILTMDDELEKALIVYGTLDEATANHEAAKLMQHALRRREHNVQPAIKADHEVSEAELAAHHLLLLGRPATNAISQRFAGQLPVDFGSQSARVRDALYIHPETALLAASDNPLNPRFSLVVVAGLGGLATYQTVGRFADDVFDYAPVVVLPFGRAQVDLVPPLPELSVAPRF